MSFFGWLTKSKMEVSALDHLIFGAEILSLWIFAYTSGVVLVKFQSWKRKRKVRK